MHGKTPPQNGFSLAQNDEEVNELFSMSDILDRAFGGVPVWKGTKQLIQQLI